MKNTTQTYLWLLFMLSVLNNVKAQQTIPVSGGNAAGSGGSVSYTVGQLIYSSSTNGNASSSGGMQQALEVVTTGTKETVAGSSEILAYPNPATTGIILKQPYQESLSYELFDINGKLLTTQTITVDETYINTEQLVAGTYVLNVNQQQSTIKTFKIIKH